MENDQRKAIAAAQAGMSERTARKYARSHRLPSEIQAIHSWRTRTDPFEAFRDVRTKWNTAAPNWTFVLAQLAQVFGDRVKKYL